MKLSRLVCSPTRLVSLVLTLAAATLGLMIACGGGELPDNIKGGTGGVSGGTGGMGMTGCANATAILTSQCNSCHSAALASSFGNLDLQTADVKSRLVGVASKGPMCMSKGAMLLEAGSSPAKGLLIDKIKSAQNCGDFMPPPGIGPLSASDISCLQAWADSLTKN